MTSVGFIGLGNMGSPMAVNLARAGYDVTGYNRTRSKVEDLVSAGGREAGSVAEAIRGADIIITMLPDSPDVVDVAYGDDGILENAGKSTLYIDMSTIRPEVAATLHDDGKRHGIRVLDAPVSGGDVGAREGVLSIMVGGEADDFQQAQGLFHHLGTSIAHVGGAGAGQTVKAANQLIVAATLEIVSEAIVFLRAHDVDLPTAMKVLGGGLAGSTVIERKADGMLKNDFSPGFRLELHHKDLGIALAAAREVGVTVPLGSAVSQLVGSMVARGEGHLDHSALLRLVELLSGQEPD